MKLIHTTAATLALLAFATSAHAQRHELTGSRVAVFNLVGDLRIEAGSGSTTSVEVERGGRDANRLEVRTANINGVSTLVVIYPADEVVVESMDRGSNTTIRVNDNGTFNDARAGRRVRISGRGDRDALHAHANIVVRLAQGTAIDANQAVGTITARGTAGALDLETTSGDISSDGNRGAVKAESASGDITVTNAQGDVDAETASGEVEIRGTTSQKVEAESASGDIVIDGVTAQDLDAETASGDVRVSRTRAPQIKAESASGDVHVALEGDVREINVSTASGSVEVAVPSGFSGEVDMETASGDIDLDFELKVTHQSRGHLRGTIGNGGTAQISLETASGDVRLIRR